MIAYTHQTHFIPSQKHSSIPNLFYKEEGYGACIKKHDMHKGQIYDFSHIILLPGQHII